MLSSIRSFIHSQSGLLILSSKFVRNHCQSKHVSQEQTFTLTFKTNYT